MNTILSLNHFCEIHGPQIILTTRLAASNSSPGSSETGASCANCSYNVPNTTTTPVLRTQSDQYTTISSRVTSDDLLREACVRALSVETLAKGQNSGSFTVNTDIATWGNTETRTVNVAHVFRIPDPRARGQRRTYALLAVGDKSLWRQQYVIHRTFESWARSIEELSDQHLRALRHQSHASESASPSLEHSLSSSMTLSSATPSPPLSLEMSLESSPPRFPNPLAIRHRASNSTSVLASPAARNMTPVSSFLSAKTVDPDGYPRSSNSGASFANLPKMRSLAEIVGDEFFFVRLHAEMGGLLGRLVESIGLDDDYENEVALDDDGVGSESDDGSRVFVGSDDEDYYGTDGDNMIEKWKVDRY